MLPERDYEEFQRIILSSTSFPHDFEISTSDYIDRCDHVHPDFTRVQVRCSKTGVTRSYLAGFASCWLRKFEHDLESGSFGTPGGNGKKPR